MQSNFHFIAILLNAMQNESNRINNFIILTVYHTREYSIPTHLMSTEQLLSGVYPFFDAMPIW